MWESLPTVAGMISTSIFAASVFPMLAKAVRTKDLGSYSLPNMLLSNVGNLVHSFYVFSMPAGPIWALHSFYLVSAGLMLLWRLRYTPKGTQPEDQPSSSLSVGQSNRTSS